MFVFSRYIFDKKRKILSPVKFLYQNPIKTYTNIKRSKNIFYSILKVLREFETHFIYSAMLNQSKAKLTFKLQTTHQTKNKKTTVILPE